MWKTIIVNFEGARYWAQAKIFDEGSEYGIDGGRISKLLICLGTTHDHAAEVYHYERGLEFDNTIPGLLGAVIKQLEAM